MYWNYNFEAVVMMHLKTIESLFFLSSNEDKALKCLCHWIACIRHVGRDELWESVLCHIFIFLKIKSKS